MGTPFVLGGPTHPAGASRQLVMLENRRDVIGPHLQDSEVLWSGVLPTSHFEIIFYNF